MTDTGVGAVTTLDNATMTADLSPNAVTNPTEPAGPLRTLLATAAATAATARRLLMGEESALGPDIAHVIRAHCYVTGRLAGTGWRVDADSDGALPVLTIQTGGVLNQTAYLDIVCQPAYDH